MVAGRGGEKRRRRRREREILFIDTLVLQGGCRSVLSDCSAEVRVGNS